MSLITVDYGTVSGGDNSVFLKLSTVTAAKVELGFKPKYLLVAEDYGNFTIVQEYDETVSTTSIKYMTNGTISTLNLGQNAGGYIYSIDNDGFTFDSYYSQINSVFIYAVP